MVVEGDRACVVIQHVEPEGPYALGDALMAAGVSLDIRKIHRGDPVPVDAEGLCGLVVMGGPMSADPRIGFPTLDAEIALIADALAREVPILGICLGAQLLAVAAGGEVHVGNAGPEIGWAPVEWTPEAGSDPLLAASGPGPTVLHWHGDTYTLPPAAVRLAGSASYEQQAFRVGSAWGLQFHVEVDEGAVEAFLAAFGDELRFAGVEPQRIRERSVVAVQALAPVREAWFARFCQLAVGYKPLATVVVSETTLV